LGKADSGLFSFFQEDNVELLVKVLNGCATNGHHWVFYSAATNVGFELTVEDKKTGTRRTYTNPLRVVAQPELDTRAFATCP